MELLKKQNNFQIQTKGMELVKDDNGNVKSIILEGYASTKNKDRVNEIVLPSAFEKALSLYMQNPRVFLQHDSDKNVGKTIEAKINSKGLYVKTEIMLNISLDGTDGVRLFEAIEKGLYKTYSIGYNVKDAEEKEVKQDGVVVAYEWIIKELELMEISLVSVPANPYALIKSINDCLPENTKLNKEEGIKQLKEMTGEAKIVKTEEEIEEKEDGVVVTYEWPIKEINNIENENLDSERPKEEEIEEKEEETQENNDINSQDTENSDESSENGDEKSSVVKETKNINLETKKFQDLTQELKKSFDISVKEIEGKYEKRFVESQKENTEFKKEVENGVLEIIKQFKELQTYTKLLETKTKSLEDTMEKIVIKKGYTYEKIPAKEKKKSIVGEALGI